MNARRKSLLAKVRALLSKTVENGCTEAEAMAALAVARRLMAEHELTEAELAAGGEGVAFEQRQRSDRDKIRDALASSVGRFCHCRAWSSGLDCVTFAGLESDAGFAHWLLDMLGDFVQRSCRDYLATTWRRGMPRVRRLETQGFVAGCCGRIGERLDALADEADGPKSGRGLVVLKGQLIDAALAAAGIQLRERQRWRRQDTNAERAGRRRGEDASFNRPVGVDASQKLLA